MAFSRRTVAMLALAMLLGCGGEDMGPEGPLVAALQSGNAQTGPVAEALPTPSVVRISRDGAGVAGVSVAWSVTGGGGSVAPSMSTTGADGTAATTWTLGPNAGANAMQATISGANGSPVAFSATGTTGTPPLQAAVSVMDNFFDPTATTISAGGSVTWTWAGNGTTTHNVTFATGTNSSTQPTGTFTRAFADAGTFDYMCTIHGASMSGTVVVQ